MALTDAQEALLRRAEILVRTSRDSREYTSTCGSLSSSFAGHDLQPYEAEPRNLKPDGTEVVPDRALFGKLVGRLKAHIDNEDVLSSVMWMSPQLKTFRGKVSHATFSIVDKGLGVDMVIGGLRSAP